MNAVVEPIYVLIGLLVAFLLFAAAVIAILWMVLPFSVFGMKGLLRKAIAEQEKTNALLGGLLAELKGQREPLAKGPGSDDDKDAMMH